MSRVFFLLLAKIIQIRVFDRKPITIYLHPTNFQLQHLEYYFIPVNAERESKVRGVVNSFQTTTKNQKKETFLCFKSRYILIRCFTKASDGSETKKRIQTIYFDWIFIVCILDNPKFFFKIFFSLICLICLLFLNR